MVDKIFDLLIRQSKSVIPIITIAMVSISISSLILDKSKIDEIFSLLNGRKELLITGTAIFITFFIYLNYLLLKRHPRSITLSLIGLPNTGKTVFLTVLFDYLQRASERNMKFSLYGTETIEKVHSDLNLLYSKQWLPATKLSEFFFYRAFVSLGSFPFIQKYKIEIADYAGEKIDELNPNSNNWLHKTEYFNYAAQSDAIIFALDCQKILNVIQSPDDCEWNIETLLNIYIVAFQVLVEKKGAVENKRLQEPVMILFLKSDLISNSKEQDMIVSRCSRLLEVCKNRALFTETFFVSSVGRNYLDNRQTIQPENIAKPLKWLLGRIQ